MFSSLFRGLLTFLPFTVMAIICAALVIAGNFQETFLENAEYIVILTRQHITLVLQAIIPAMFCGLTIGIVMSRPRMRRHAEWVMQILNIGNTVPTLAVIALSMGVLGIGTPPAIFALWLLSLLPIARNTYIGLISVPADFIEASRGLGMRPLQILWQVELPNAISAIAAGVRTATTIAIGTAPLAFLIGSGGLGELIFSGIAVYDVATVISGAVPVVLLAMMADAVIQILSRSITSRGLLQ